MDIILQLYGALVLTLLGFVLPILSIAIVLLPDGVKCLQQNYENEKTQSEDNLLTETTKKVKGEVLDYRALEKTIKALKDKKRDAINKLAYLDPKKLILRISLPFVLTLIILIFSLQNYSYYVKLILLIFSLFSSLAGVIALWKSVMCLVEVSSAVNKNKRTYEDKVIELLSMGANNGPDSLFLKHGEINAKLNNNILEKEKFLEFSANKQHEIPVSIINNGELMAKTVEIGFIFPKDFLIEDTSNISIYTGETNQTIRVNSDMVQSHENLQCGSIKVTFLKAGTYPIETFIKGENVKYSKFVFKLKIVE